MAKKIFNINAFGWNKKTCTQEFSQTKNNLYCMNDDICSTISLIKHGLIKVCIEITGRLIIEYDGNIE